MAALNRHCRVASWGQAGNRLMTSNSFDGLVLLSFPLAARLPLSKNTQAALIRFSWESTRSVLYSAGLWKWVEGEWWGEYWGCGKAGDKEAEGGGRRGKFGGKEAE